MRRIFTIGALVVLAVGLSWGQALAGEPGGQPPGGVAKTPAQKGGQRLLNPGALAARLFRMSPEERDRALEKLPADARENARRTLAWFDGLAPDVQALQLRRLEHFAQLPPDKKIEVRQMVKEANLLEPPRKRAVGQALLRLQGMTDEEREATIRRPAFQSRFSLQELKIIIALADAWMGPQ